MYRSLKERAIESVIDFFDKYYNIKIDFNIKIDIKFKNIDKIITGYYDYTIDRNIIIVNHRYYKRLNIDEKEQYWKMIYNTILHELGHNVLKVKFNNLSEFIPIELQQKYGQELDCSLYLSMLKKSNIDLNKKSILERYFDYKRYKGSIYNEIIDEYRNNIEKIRANIFNHYGTRLYNFNDFMSETEYGAIFLDGLNKNEKLINNKTLTDISRSFFGFIYNSNIIIDGLNIEDNFKNKIIDDMIKDITNIYVSQSYYLEKIKDKIFISSSLCNNISI